MADLQKKVLVTQLSEEQQKYWHSLLTSQGLNVLVEPASNDLIQVLENMVKTNQQLPHLLLMDIGITKANSTSLHAREVCRWCTDNYPDIKVILTSPREDQVRSAGMRWATRQGAVDLLPRLYKESLVTSITKVLEVLGIKPNQPSLDKFIESFESSDSDNDEIRQLIESPSNVIREAATADLVRKMAMIPMIVMATSEAEDESETDDLNISLASTLDELALYDSEVDLDSLGINASNAFKDDPLLPGVILTESGSYVGMISRQRFLDFMSRPYSLELFSKRPLRVLYESAETKVLVLDGKSLVVSSAQECLGRSPELIYEPIVVLSEGSYKLLDVHDLFVAQSKIHELATKLIREQTQDRMVQTEKMATLGEIVSEVSHDLGTPVESIHSNLTYLSDYSSKLINLIKAYEEETTMSVQIAEIKDAINIHFILEDLPKVVNGIVAGTVQLKKIVSGLQTFSKMEEVISNDIDINDCVENSLAILNTRIHKDIILVKDLGKLPHLTGFSSQLVQVFMNLIGNAIDALTDIMTLPKALKGDWKPKIEISTKSYTHDGTDWILVKIADNGSGIPEEIQPKIFENFYATKDSGKGKGLGLAISHQIITQNHKGKISLRSPWLDENNDIGGGAEFQVLLPIS
jgi:two-component system, NtrC family, sensor kinase